MTEPGERDHAVDEAVMDLLADHVPLTLLVDLVDAPRSEQVLVEEGLPADSWWEQVPRQGGRSDAPDDASGEAVDEGA